MPKAVVFFWENFGPMHLDRVEAVHAALAPRVAVTGLEFRSVSETYSWTAGEANFPRITLFAGVRESRLLRRIGRVLGACAKLGRGDYFLCHYEWPEVFATACYLRLTGSRVFAMIDSKFDDKARRIGREWVKWLALLPYSGALAGSRRTEEYLRYLGMGRRPIALDYDTISIERIRDQSGTQPAPAGLPFAERDFVCVARLVPKKNHKTLLRAYARYRQLATRPRLLHLCGDGPERPGLEELARELGIAEHVRFHGFVQTREVSQQLGRSLALLLVSTEEQFGQVILEAQAMGLPVIVSDNCGARDKHVRTGINGFVVEPDNVEGIARFMTMLSDDEALWTRYSSAALRDSSAGDVAGFVRSVQVLLGNGRGRE
jgi:glycosyltransferase involved in cell wall biosynthesis